jgi:hypothetical protein
MTRAILTKVDTGFVKKKCYKKGIERGFDSIKTCYALGVQLALLAGAFIPTRCKAP